MLLEHLEQLLRIRPSSQVQDRLGPGAMLKVQAQPFFNRSCLVDQCLVLGFASQRPYQKGRLLFSL